MRFSTRSFFLVIAFYTFVIAITFSLQSLFGLLLMMFLAMFVFPPFVQVGAFTTRGITQGFFIGTAIGGIPHFVLTLYLGVYGAMGGLFEFESLFKTNDTCAYFLVGNLVGIGLSSIGGLSGLISYGLLHGFSNPKKSEVLNANSP